MDGTRILNRLNGTQHNRIGNYNKYIGIFDSIRRKEKRRDKREGVIKHGVFY